MIESIIIKNKKGDSIKLSLDEVEELKEDLEKLESVKPQYHPTLWVPVYYPQTGDTIYPWWQNPVTSTGTYAGDGNPLPEDAGTGRGVTSIEASYYD